MHTQSSNQRGYTLLELMVVIAIIAILAGIAYPSYMRYVRDARLQNAKTDILMVQNLLEKYYAQNHRFHDGSNYPNSGTNNVLTNVNNEYFNIAFYTQDNAGSGLVCSPATAASDQYCLYAAPKENNNGESRFVFVDTSGAIQECEKGGASVSTAGVLTNKWQATCAN